MNGWFIDLCLAASNAPTGNAAKAKKKPAKGLVNIFLIDVILTERYDALLRCRWLR